MKGTGPVTGVSHLWWTCWVLVTIFMRKILTSHNNPCEFAFLILVALKNLTILLTLSRPGMGRWGGFCLLGLWTSSFWEIQKSNPICTLKNSTKMALVRVHNNVLLALDNQQSVILLLLDLRPHLTRWITEFYSTACPPDLASVPEWVRSYLSERKQFVSVNYCISSHLNPQRST